MKEQGSVLRFFFLSVLFLTFYGVLMGQTPFIKVIQPNGGESWAVGTTHLISWNDNFTQPVKIMLSTDNGQHYQTIANSVEGTTWSWEISKNQEISENCLIKVVSTVNDQYADESNYTFAITAVPEKSKIHVIQPNVKNIEWAVGTTHKISWNTNLSGKVDLYLIHCEPDGSETQPQDSILISKDVLGSTYDWEITNATKYPVYGYYKIRVSSSSDTTVTDLSNNTFAITALPKGSFIKVLQPNVKHIEWAVGTTHKISWNTNLSGKVDLYLIHCEPDGSETQPQDSILISKDVLGSTYDWEITNTTEYPVYGYYKIRVSSSSDTTVTDLSNNTFAITALPKGTFLTIIKPSDYDTLLIGSQYLISWNTNYRGKFKLYLVDISSVTTPGAKPWVSYLGSTTGTTFGWTVPDTVRISHGYAICISNSDSTLVRQSGLFIVRKVKGTITVLSPNGGEKWAAGSTHLISWKSNVLGKFNIGIIRPGGGSDLTAIATNVPGSTYAWTLPDIQGDLEVIVSSVDNPNIFDISDSVFHVLLYPPGSFIHVIQPDGGEKWQIGSSHLISWNTNLSGPFVIHLIKANDATANYVLADSVMGTTWSWKIDTTINGISIGPGSDYKIRIFDKKFGVLFGESDTCFTLLATPVIDAYPNPVATQLTLKFDNKDNENYSLALYNRYYLKVFSRKVNTAFEKELRINTANLPNGIYFLRLVSEKGIISRKIVVQH